MEKERGGGQGTTTTHAKSFHSGCHTASHTHVYLARTTHTQANTVTLSIAVFLCSSSLTFFFLLLHTRANFEE